MALSIFVPIGYITVLVISLSIFSRVYRKRTAQALVREHGQPWFPEGHPERDIYQTLVQAAAATASDADKAPVVPDAVLKAALLNRAMADVRRIIRMRDDKQALSTLLQKGSIGDETMSKFSMAEKELEAEILDVVSEANTFREGWGQLIFPTASEMVGHLKHKDVYYGIQQQRDEEIKKLLDAGKPVPKPNVTLPPLMTPAGTSITIQAPAGMAPPQANGTQGAQKLAAVSAALAANGKTEAPATTTKSGTVEEADDEAIERARKLADSIPAALEEYEDMESPSAFLNGDIEDLYASREESYEFDASDDGDSQEAIELIYKDPTPISSANSAFVDQFVQQQTSKAAALANPSAAQRPAQIDEKATAAPATAEGSKSKKRRKKKSSRKNV